MRYLIILLLLQSTLSAQTVKFSQVERTSTKWEIPSAYRSSSVSPPWMLKYIGLPALMDSLGIYTGPDSIYNTGNIIRLRDGAGQVTMTGGGGADTQFIMPIPSTGTANGFRLTQAQDTVIFVVDQTVDYNNTNELQTVMIDSSENATQKVYRLWLDPPLVPGSPVYRYITVPKATIQIDSTENVDREVFRIWTNPQTPGTPTYSYITVPKSSAGGTPGSVSLGSDFVSSTTTVAPALTYTLPTTGRYMVQFWGTWTSSATANGCKASFTLSGGGSGTQLTGYGDAAIVGTAAASNVTHRLNGFGAEIVAPTAGSATIQHLKMDAIINVTTVGTLNLNFGAEASASTSTLQTGATMVITKIQ